MYNSLQLLYLFRVGARRQDKLRRIAETEESLLEHPLGLYPHLEEALPSEVMVL